MMQKCALVFPGQGSQSLGMLSELAQQFPVVRDTFQEAADCLGYDLWSLTQDGPLHLLNQTEHTQPALLAASVALWRIWQVQHGIQPVFLAGHSLGEYSALVCAESLDYATALTLVALRGRLMQEAVVDGAGAMAAIVGLDDAAVMAICQQAAQGQVVTPANYNAIGQVVIAGETAAVDRAVTLAQQAGSKLAKKIPVSVPSHCPLMEPAAQRLAERLEHITINRPRIPVVHNVDVACYDEPARIRSALVRQLYLPVRWVETIRYLANQGVDGFVECGPGKILAGLNKRIEADLTTVSIATPAALQSALGVVTTV